MAYTAENIANIRRDGQLDSYLAHDRQLVASLEDGEVEIRNDIVSIAHLYGRFGIDAVESAAFAEVVAGGAWRKQWKLDGFNDQKHALAYAKGALVSELKTVRKTLLAEARTRVAALEAAM